MDLTTKQLSERLNVDYLTASSLIKLLLSKGLITELPNKIPPPSGKGKPSSVFRFVSNTITFTF